MTDADKVIERLIDSLVSGERIGCVTLAQQLDGADDIISVNEVLAFLDASIANGVDIDKVLDIQLRVRARAVLKAKELLDTPRGQDLVSEHMQPEEV